MEFDIARFRIRRCDGEFWEADLPAILHHFQDAYFAHVKPPIEAAEFVPAIGDSGSPACVLPNQNRIEIDERLRHFTKLCCILVLHELVNNKLFKKHGAVSCDTGPDFQDELKCLLEDGAYFGLL